MSVFTKNKNTKEQMCLCKKQNKKKQTKKCTKEYFQKITEKVILMFYCHFVKAALPKMASLLKIVK